MAANQPFIYEASRHDSRFPTSTFDPKAVTKASIAPRLPRPKHEGPLVSFNRHPDAHMLPPSRPHYQTMSSRAKSWIKGMRSAQLLLRALELVGALGLFVLLILLTGIDELTGWVMRITPAIVAVHCGYAMYHLARPASARNPGSSAAYHVFAAISDMCILPLYAYGLLAARNHGSQWYTRFSMEATGSQVFVSAVYYLYLATSGLHLVSFCISLWLGVMFRRITMMPPDMNPLEDHLTTRARHKRNKSSVVTTSTITSEEQKRLSTPLEVCHRSGHPYESLARGPTIPFLQSRLAGSGESLQSWDARLDLPSRQYQFGASSSPRNSVTSVDFKNMLGTRSSNRGSYTEIPLGETAAVRPDTAGSAAQQRRGKFTETWTTTESLISRTQQRNRAMNAATAAGAQNRGSKSYEALTQRYGFPESSDSESDHDENNLAGSDFETDVGSSVHPNPLRSNPPTPPRSRTPFRPSTARSSTLQEVNPNERSVSGSMDIADEKYSGSPRKTWVRNRMSSIQPEADFYSKPYGELKPATPPIMVGSSRQVSSGNDYDTSYSSAYGRRNVSGKVVEEGRADARGHYSRYSAFNA